MGVVKLPYKIILLLAIGLLLNGIYQTADIKRTDTASGSPLQSLKNKYAPALKETDGSNLDLVTVVAEGLDTPWAITFLPDDSMLVTERKGTVRLVKSGLLQSDPVATITSVREIGEGGLQGIAVHPNFKSNKFVYVYYTFSGGEAGTLNRVSRFTFDGNSMTDEVKIVDNIPGAQNHNGGRIKFGPDGKLYITTGDAQNPSLALDKNSLAGKILRVNDDGTVAPGNPFNNAIYSFGHRNPQGIAWDKDDTLWSTEHGPSGTETGNDELNKIITGANYGWPDIKGKQIREGMRSPEIESGFLNTWAPAGLAYLNGKLYFSGLRGASLYRVDPTDLKLDTYFKGEFGRLREVVSGPDNMLYVTTSNNDGRGKPILGDDKILRINPIKL